MRLKCEYKTDKIPVANRMMFVSLIKESLKKVNEEYFNKLYNYEGKKNKKIKNFSFAVFIKDFIIFQDEIEVKDKVVLNITTPDYEFGINIYNALLSMDEFKYKEFILNKIKISLVKEKFINSRKVVFKTLSPICIKDNNNNFLTPKDEAYEREFNYIINKNLECHRGYGLKEPLQFQEVLMKKVVVKEEIKDFTSQTGKKTFYVNAYSGIFKLTGDMEDLNFICQSGVGFRRSQGFGMIESV